MLAPLADRHGSVERLGESSFAHLALVADPGGPKLWVLEWSDRFASDSGQVLVGEVSIDAPSPQDGGGGEQAVGLDAGPGLCVGDVKDRGGQFVAQQGAGVGRAGRLAATASTTGPTSTTTSKTGGGQSRSIRPVPQQGLSGRPTCLSTNWATRLSESRGGDPIFGAGVCRVPACERSATGGYGLCQGHHLRWNTAGRPDMDSFAAATDPRWGRQQPNMVCRVDGCRYGCSRGGMCLTHCDLWSEAAGRFCHSHAATWRANGRPDVKMFVGRFSMIEMTADQIVRLDAPPPQLRLELQYALQCRRDERATKSAPAVVMAVVRFLAKVEEHSLLDRTEHAWRASTGRPAPFLVYARRRVEDLAHGGGWEDEYDRDVWQLRRVGFEGNQTLRFDTIPQPWLRDLAKRWVRWRLGTGLVIDTVRRGLRTVTRFAGFCDRIGVKQVADIDREVLERYLADLHAEMAGRPQHGVDVGQLNSFLTAIRLHGWDPALSATALLFSTDNPKRAERPPRALTEQVMAHVERPDTLARFADPGTGWSP